MEINSKNMARFEGPAVFSCEIAANANSLRIFSEH